MNEKSLNSKECEKVLKKLQKRKELLTKQITQIKEDLETEKKELQSGRGRKVTSYGDVAVYELYIETPVGNCKIDDIQASIEDASSARFTVTRLVGLGILALGAKKHEGVIYVLVKSPDFEYLIEYGPKDKELAIRTVTNLNNLAKQAKFVKEKLPEHLEEVNKFQALLNSGKHELQEERKQLDSEIKEAEEKFNQAVENEAILHNEQLDEKLKLQKSRKNRVGFFRGVNSESDIKVDELSSKQKFWLRFRKQSLIGLSLLIAILAVTSVWGVAKLWLLSQKVCLLL